MKYLILRPKFLEFELKVEDDTNELFEELEKTFLVETDKEAEFIIFDDFVELFGRVRDPYSMLHLLCSISGDSIFERLVPQLSPLS